MDEFRHLNWSWRAYASDVDLEKSYHLDMGKNATVNAADVFHCNLLQIEPTHLIDSYQQEKARTASTQERTASSANSEQRHFTDPRTRITIPTFTCDHRDVDLATRNMLLAKNLETSKLSAAEHLAGLEAIPKLKLDKSALSTEDAAHRATYLASAQMRSEEKSRFLAFLKRNYSERLSHRYHLVNPAIESFVTGKWKRRLLELCADSGNDAYRMSTALRVIPRTDIEISVDLVYQEHHGDIAKMLSNATILRQSSERLIRAYNRYCHERLVNSIQARSVEIAGDKQVNAIVPLSVMKLLVSDCDRDWSVRVSVRNGKSSSILNPVKEVAFEKPLPPLYLSGHERAARGHKYVLRSIVCPPGASSFSHSTKIESVPMNNFDEEIECAVSGASDYKLQTVEEFAAKYSERSDRMACVNYSFRIWNMSDGSETIRVMVPAKTDAFQVNEVDGDVEMVNLSSKVEFQAEYGAEEMSRAQLLREWCHQYFRPDSVTMRFRCDVESGRIIKTESVKLDEIEESLRNLYGIERGTLLKHLWTSLQIFLTFPNGDFLLRHTATKSDDNNLIKVYQKCDQTDTTFTIASIYDGVGFEKSHFDAIHWQPIDDQLITDIHRTANLLPCAFPSTSYCESTGIGHSATKPQAKGRKGQEDSTEAQIKPKDDSEWVAKRSKARKAIAARPKQLQKQRKNAAKRQKKKLKKLKEKAEKNAQRVEAIEMASLKAISVDEYMAVDKPVEPTPNFSAASEPRLTRKRASQKFVRETAPPIDIVSAQHEITKRRVSGFLSPTRPTNESASESGTESSSPVTTRSGRVVRTRQM